MPRFFSNKRLILLLVGVIVLVALISFSLRDRHNASLPEQIVKDVVGFGQSIFSKPAHYITDVIGNIDGILNTYEENKILKERLSEYASNQAELTDMSAQKTIGCVTLSVKKTIFVHMSQFMRQSLQEIQINGKKKLLLTKVKFTALKKTWLS